MRNRVYATRLDARDAHIISCAFRLPEEVKPQARCDNYMQKKQWGEKAG